MPFSLAVDNQEKYQEASMQVFGFDTLIVRK